MHEYGDENVSESDILKAVERLNQDFQKLTAEVASVSQSFKSRIGDGKIAFKLAKLDPEGNCTTGFTKHATKLTNGGDDALKLIVQWPPERYLNIWVEKSMTIKASAYAYFPGAPEILDGIVILKNTFILDKIVLAHEVGHYLNLAHVWGFNNNTFMPENCALSDFVDDTPTTTGSNNNCNLNQNICVPGIKENVENIMDYSTCKKMFTIGQVNRMHAALNASISGRNNLWTDENLARTGTNDGFTVDMCPPVADFSNKNIRICEGETITILNVSYRNYTKSSWFALSEKGDLLETQDGTFTFHQAGQYDVGLIVSNDAGLADTLIRKGIVEVTPKNSINQPSMQDFETFTKLEDQWSVESEVGTTWEINQDAAFSGIKSLILIGDSLNNGTSDIFYTNSYNFGQLNSPEFSFKLAYAGSPTSKDQLKIFLSKDCGKTWQLKYSKTGQSLMTTSSEMDEFVPTELSQWRTDFMNVASLKNESFVLFKFEFISDGKNNIFIDDISFGLSSTSGTSESIAQNITLYPNPTNGASTLQINTPISSDIQYAIKDIHGKIVSKDIVLDSLESTYIVLSNPLHAGIYFIDIVINGSRHIKKWVVIE